MSPVDRQQPGLRLYRERDQLAAGDPAELLWIVYEEPVLALAVGGKHWYKSPLVGWAVPDGRAVQDAALARISERPAHAQLRERTREIERLKSEF